MAINTAALRRPELIRECADRFGSQAVVVSIEARRWRDGRWKAYTNQGRDDSGWPVFEWMEEAVRFGAGEILLNTPSDTQIKGQTNYSFCTSPACMATMTWSEYSRQWRLTCSCQLQPVVVSGPWETSTDYYALAPIKWPSIPLLCGGLNLSANAPTTSVVRLWW